MALKGLLIIDMVKKSAGTFSIGSQQLGKNSDYWGEKNTQMNRKVPTEYHFEQYKFALIY